LEISVVVNAQARAKVAQGLEQYVRCEIENDSLAGLLNNGAKTDTACYELHFAMVDVLYDVLRTHRNEGKYELTATHLKMIQRWIRFLQTEVEWPLPTTKDMNPMLQVVCEVLRCVKAFLLGTSPFNNEYWPLRSLEDWQRFESDAGKKTKLPCGSNNCSE
jgi:hypothetical protein